MQKSLLINRDQEKKILAEAKRFNSLIKQSVTALENEKWKRREQLLLEALKVARRLKEMQVDWAPDQLVMQDLADDSVVIALIETGKNYWLLDRDNNEVSDRCLPYLAEALDLLESQAEPDYEKLFDAYDFLCQIYVGLKDKPRYEDTCRKALALKEKQVGQWHADIIPFLMDLSWSLEEQGKHKESVAIKKDALGIVQNKEDAQEAEVIAIKHGVAYSTHLSEGMSEIEAVQKALASLTDDERKIFTGRVAEELQGLR